jgi:anti-anti-sigma regulatory factor
VLAERLPGLGIPSCYLALYENPQPYVYLQPAPEWSRLMLAYTDQGRIALEPEGRRFRSHEILPEDVLPAGRQFNLVMEPLYFQKNQLGFIVFEARSRNGAMYAALRTDISSALQGALLLRAQKEAEASLEQAYMKVEQQVRQRTTELKHETAERERAQAESLRLQQEIIKTQQRSLQELSTPIIPVWEDIIIMPLIGSVDSARARDITRALLAGISRHRAKVVIIDVTGVPLVDSNVAGHLHKTIQAAQLKGARTIVTGITAAVAETIVDLGIDWSRFETLSDLQTGLRTALTT